MKKSVFYCPLAMAIGLLFFMNSVHAQSSQKANLFNSLNGLLEKYSMTEVRLELLDDGTILRKDGNGNFFKFNLKDIKNFEIDYDGVIGNLLLKCDPNQDCIYYEMDGGSRKGKIQFQRDQLQTRHECAGSPGPIRTAERSDREIAPRPSG